MKQPPIHYRRKQTKNQVFNRWIISNITFDEIDATVDPKKAQYINVLNQICQCPPQPPSGTTVRHPYEVIFAKKWRLQIDFSYKWNFQGCPNGGPKSHVVHQLDPIFLLEYCHSPTPTSTTTPTPTQQKAGWDTVITKNHHNHPTTTTTTIPPPPPHHKLKLHERMRIEQNLENKRC